MQTSAIPKAKSVRNQNAYYEPKDKLLYMLTYKHVLLYNELVK